MTREFLNPGGMSKPVGYTHAVTATSGKQVFISGQVALDAEGQLVGRGDLSAQTRQVCENLKTAVTAAGGSLADVVKITTYVVNYQPADRTVIAEVRNQYFPTTNSPASTLVGVQALAREGFLIEIEAIVVVG